MNVLEKSCCLASNKAIHKRHTIKKQSPFTHEIKPIVIHPHFSGESHLQYQILLSTSLCICQSKFMARLSHLYRRFCHALSLSLAASHGKATIQVEILLCHSSNKIILAFRGGSKSLPEEGSYLWVSSLKLLPLEKAAEGRSGVGCTGDVQWSCVALQSGYGGCHQKASTNQVTQTAAVMWEVSLE